MNFRLRSPLAIAAAAVLALSACEADSTGTNLEAEGSTVFTYTGDDAGTFNATGRFNRNRPGTGTFSVGTTGELDDGTQAMVVLAHVPRPGNTLVADEFLLSLEDPAVGTRTCTVADVDSCTFGAFLFLGALASGQTEQIYTSIGGTLTITSISDDRARGTFSLQMESFSVDDVEADSVQITNGTFDVPLVDNVT